MSLADDLKPFALEALAAGVGVAIREFTARDPDAATKAAAAAKLAKQALDLLPVSELRDNLTDEDAARAELAYALAKIARYTGA